MTNFFGAGMTKLCSALWKAVAFPFMFLLLVLGVSGFDSRNQLRGILQPDTQCIVQSGGGGSVPVSSQMLVKVLKGMFTSIKIIGGSSPTKV